MKPPCCLKDLEDNGDYVNSKEFPSLIKASLVFDNLDKNMLVIDLRHAGSFKKGHIKRAVNKRFEDLPAYFESGIKPFEYDKIILVSEDGQQASLYHLPSQADGLWQCICHALGNERLE